MFLRDERQYNMLFCIYLSRSNQFFVLQGQPFFHFLIPRVQSRATEVKMAAPVRRRTDLTLKDKYKIACYIDDHSKEIQKDIAAQFSIPKSTMSRLASNVSQIKRVYHENTMASNSKRMRKPSFDDLDSSLLTWFS